MNFFVLFIIELGLCMAAGTVFMAGKKGIVLAIGFLTLLNGWAVMFHEGERFWLKELIILLGGGLGTVFLNFFNEKAKKHHMVMGLTGGIISLVLFGAFFSTITAILVWALAVGTGLIPKQRKNSVLWGIAPTLWRCILGTLVIIYGNILV